jgi:endogenous inhibitor of DNA gyrase (YacG/DUF329 family)
MAKTPKDATPKVKAAKSTSTVKISKGKIKSLRCPTCSKLVLASDEDFPFCSDRCRRIDLGKWAMGVYKISSPVLDPDLLEDLEGNEREQ